MESKRILIVLIYCVIVNAQLISSLRRTTKIRKFKLPSCGCQNPVGLPSGCSRSNSCGCANPGMCGCQKYWDQIEIPSCSLEMPSPFAVDIPYNLPPETCSCRSMITLPYDYMSSIDTMPLNPCGCQAPRKPCGCETPVIQPTNIYDLLSYLDIPCGCQNGVKLSSYDYVPCGCGIPLCGCQVLRDATLCGCHTGTIIPNYIAAIEPVTAVFSELGVPFSCGCDGSYYMPDISYGCQVCGKPNCACQASTCNYGCQRCGYGCGCGCGPRCECGGKYLRQVTLQPPFL